MTDITQLRVAIGKQLGYTAEESATPSLLRQADAIKLGDYVFAYVYKNPSEFSDAQVAIAKQHYAAWGTNTPLQDPSFDWGLLASEMGDNALAAGAQIAGIGQGILGLAGAMKYIIPIGGILIISYLIWKKIKR